VPLEIYIVRFKEKNLNRNHWRFEVRIPIQVQIFLLKSDDKILYM
jgi:hypothetical protein